MTTEPMTRITKTPGVCGGDACIRGHRIPVWGLVRYRQLEMSDAGILDRTRRSPKPIWTRRGLRLRDAARTSRLRSLPSSVHKSVPSPIPAASPTTMGSLTAAALLCR